MRVRGIRLSTGQTLSILTTAVVVAVMAIGIAVTWATLRQSAIETARDRVTRGARQLATLLGASVRASQQRYLAVSTDPAIRRALESDAPSDIAAGRAALAKLQTSTDSGLPVELWRLSDHRRVAFVGNDLPTPPSLNIGG